MYAEIYLARRKNILNAYFLINFSVNMQCSQPHDMKLSLYILYIMCILQGSHRLFDGQVKI
jgi:hypothetical protein